MVPISIFALLDTLLAFNMPIMKKPSVSIFFDKRNIKEGYYSVKWAVYFNGEQKYYSTGLVIDKHEVEFLKKNKGGLSGKIKDLALRTLWNRVYGESYIDPLTEIPTESIIRTGQRALSQIESYFTFQLFGNVVAGKFKPDEKQVYPTDLLKALLLRSANLEKDEKLGNSDLFKYTARSFMKFAVFKNYTTDKKPEIPFHIVTEKFLRDYEKWMLKFGKTQKSKGKGQPKPIQLPASTTMIGIYCRNVRTVFNEAINEKVIDADLYPFKKNGYKIPSSRNKKKALDESVIYSIFNYDCKPGSKQEQGRDLWILSYLCNGINLTDLCNLRRYQKDFTNGYIDIIREKTKETNREDQQHIRIMLGDKVLEIIEKWGNPDQREGGFLFSFIDDNMTPREKKQAILRVMTSVNYHMNKIAANLDIDIKINTYEARHSFATTLLRSDAPLAFISQSLGHSSMATTQRYLGSFEVGKAKEYLSALIPKSENNNN